MSLILKVDKWASALNPNLGLLSAPGAAGARKAEFVLLYDPREYV